MTTYNTVYKIRIPVAMRGNFFQKSGNNASYLGSELVKSLQTFGKFLKYFTATSKEFSVNHTLPT